MATLLPIVGLGVYVVGMFAARDLVTRRDRESETGFLAYLTLMAFPPAPILIWLCQRISERRTAWYVATAIVQASESDAEASRSRIEAALRRQQGVALLDCRFDEVSEADQMEWTATFADNRPLGAAKPASRSASVQTRVWSISAVLATRAAERPAANDAVARALCPDEHHEGLCPLPWTMISCRFDDLEIDEQRSWRTEIEHGRDAAAIAHKFERISPMSEWTHADLDEFARRYRYRRALSWHNARPIGLLLIICLTWPPMAVVFAFQADSTFERLQSLGILSFSLGVTFFSVRYLRRPVRPDRDDDFERELRGESGARPGS